MMTLMTNEQIYSIASMLEANPIGDNTYIPVVYNFYIQRNINTMLELKKNIDKCREQIIKHYGNHDESKQMWMIREDCREAANKELAHLAEISQNVEITKLPLNVFADIKLSTQELRAIMFMIDVDSVDPTETTTTFTVNA